jgi:hypothetical protein
MGRWPVIKKLLWIIFLIVIMDLYSKACSKCLHEVKGKKRYVLKMVGALRKRESNRHAYPLKDESAAQVWYAVPTDTNHDIRLFVSFA